MPPNVEKLFDRGPRKLNPPKIINTGTSKTSAIAISQEEIIGNSEKKSIFRMKPKGVVGDSIKELIFGKPYSKKNPSKTYSYRPFRKHP
jgi:hypothetical protein